MPLSSILTKIKHPLSNNKKLYSIVTLSIVAMGVLGIAYYFHIQSNHKNFKAYQFQLLDSHYKKISKHFDHVIVKEVTNWGEDLDQKTSNPDTSKISNDSLRKKIYNKINQQKLEEIIFSSNAFEEFDEFYISVQLKKSQNKKYSPKKFHFSSLKTTLSHLTSDSLFKISTINEVRYLSFPSKYYYQSKLVTGIEMEVFIIGLVQESRFETLTRKLDPLLIAILIIFLFLAIIGLPFFKMIFISEDEQLSNTDVMLAGVTTILGVPVIVILFLSLYTYSERYFIELPNQLKNLSTEINNRFQKENREIVKRLKLFDFSTYDEKVKTPIKETTFINFDKKDSTDKHYFKFISKVASTEMEKLKSGDVAYHVNFVEAPPKPDSDKKKIITNLNKRTYFQDYTSGINRWKSNGQDYVMRSMVAIADGKEEAVYILKNGSNNYYKVGSVQLQSLHHPILPFGYEFAVIDREGDVQFHSEKGKATYAFTQ